MPARSALHPGCTPPRRRQTRPAAETPALKHLPDGLELANTRTRARIEAAVLELLADAPAVKPD
jgi:hypothetical protein